MNADANLLEKSDATEHAARILVVEDERIVASCLRLQLTALGYDVVDTVPSGKEAIRQTKEQIPDLVLMDINLEGPMDGVQAAAIIRKEFRLPVVYLTAYSNADILERAKTTEPFGYILKPFEDRELHVVIETALYKHRMERRQQERQEWFVATLKSIGDAVVATDDACRITYMNPMAERLTGWACKEAFGHSLNDVVRLIHEVTKQPVDVQSFPAIPVSEPSADVLLIEKDNSEIAIESCVTLITNELGDVVGRVVVFRDITWRKRLEGQLQQKKKLEAIGRFAGGVAHSLNNLMTVVIGHSEIVLGNMESGNPHRASIQEIMRSATRTATLTRKLLAFGRRQVLRLRSVDLNAVVRELEKGLRDLHDGIDVELILEPRLGAALADSEQLQESLLTLVDNACNAIQNGGRVTIQTANVELGEDFHHDHPEVQPGPYVLLAVADNGIGMDQEAMSRLFEPFYTKEVELGTGMGLAAVYGFVKQSGGEIEVRSQPNMGTTFRLYLPRKSA
jgi:two-component system, cell cycle sensor histidine kinase and response regulator CckA